jgi:hypothetical protein
LNCLEPRRLDSDFRWGTFRVVEARRAGVEGTPRKAGGLRGTVGGTADRQQPFQAVGRYTHAYHQTPAYNPVQTTSSYEKLSSAPSTSLIKRPTGRSLLLNLLAKPNRSNFLRHRIPPRSLISLLNSLFSFGVRHPSRWCSRFNLST